VKVRILINNTQYLYAYYGIGYLYNTTNIENPLSNSTLLKEVIYKNGYNSTEQMSILLNKQAPSSFSIIANNFTASFVDKKL